jgi:hypothetical protein
MVSNLFLQFLLVSIRGTFVRYFFWLCKHYWKVHKSSANFLLVQTLKGLQYGYDSMMQLYLQMVFLYKILQNLLDVDFADQNKITV